MKIQQVEPDGNRSKKMRLADTLPDVDAIRSLLDYDPMTGVLVWKAGFNVKHMNSRYGGKPINNLSRDGYIRVSINKIRMQAHRVCWALHHGSWPDQSIDHINGVRNDNRISNLRSVTHAENLKNCRLHRNTKSGVCGVYWYEKRKKWIAGIVVDYKSVHLGYFENLDDARRARREAETKFGFHENHGVAA